MIVTYNRRNIFIVQATDLDKQNSVIVIKMILFFTDEDAV